MSRLIRLYLTWSGKYCFICEGNIYWRASSIKQKFLFIVGLLLHFRIKQMKCFAGAFWRCVPLWNTERGATAQPTTDSREDVLKLPEESASSMVSAHRQPTGNEAVWQQKSASQRAHPAENSRPLGDPSM